MTCGDVRPLLAAYQDGELDAARGVQVEEHLRNCERCRLVVENLRTLTQVVQPAYFPAPAGLRENILTAIAEAQPASNVVHMPRRSTAWLLHGLSLAAALALGFFLARTFERPSGDNALLAQLTDS